MKLIGFLRGFLFCLLGFLVFSILGLFIAGWMGAGQGQGLAAGAVVVGNGVMVGLGGVVIALIVIRFSSKVVVKGLNFLLLVIFVALVIYLAVRYQSTAAHERDTELLPMIPTQTEAISIVPVGITSVGLPSTNAWFRSSDLPESDILVFDKASS